MFLLSACCLIFTLNTYSQNGQHYDKFKLGLGAGYIFGKPAGYHGYTSDGDQFTTSGFILTLEPAYRVRDNIAAGLRLEVEVYPGDPAPAVLASVTINGQYYFTDEQFRPFVGVGLGIFASKEKKTYNQNIGFYPRLGFDWGHFTLALEFNLIPGAASGYDFVTNTTQKSSAYYLGVRVGGFFFGGKK